MAFKMRLNRFFLNFLSLSPLGFPCVVFFCFFFARYRMLIFASRVFSFRYPSWRAPSSLSPGGRSFLRGRFPWAFWLFTHHHRSFPVSCLVWCSWRTWPLFPQPSYGNLTDVPSWHFYRLSISRCPSSVVSHILTFVYVCVSVCFFFASMKISTYRRGFMFFYYYIICDSMQLLLLYWSPCKIVDTFNDVRPRVKSLLCECLLRRGYWCLLCYQYHLTYVLLIIRSSK